MARLIMKYAHRRVSCHGHWDVTHRMYGAMLVETRHFALINSAPENGLST